jgi:hypothetical protein
MPWNNIGAMEVNHSLYTLALDVGGQLNVPSGRPPVGLEKSGWAPEPIWIEW